MSLIDDISSKLPFSKKEEIKEYFFALNISSDKLKVGLWTIEGNELRIVDFASGKYSTQEELITVTDRLLDQALGERNEEPEKILFGVPDNWLEGDDLKEAYLKNLRQIVKELELKPMAYVSTSHALCHFLEKQEGVPTTAILVGLEDKQISVTVARAGKIDGTKVMERKNDTAEEIEKALLSFSGIEVLPSKILIYGSSDDLKKHKQELLSFSWMLKLSFLHFPKIEILETDSDLKAVCFVGAEELNPDIKYKDVQLTPVIDSKEELVTDLSKKTKKEIEEENTLVKDEAKVAEELAEGKVEEEVEEELEEPEGDKDEDLDMPVPVESGAVAAAGGGFVVGDVLEKDAKLPKEELDGDNFSSAEDLENEEEGLEYTRDSGRSSKALMEDTVMLSTTNTPKMPVSFDDSPKEVDAFGTTPLAKGLPGIGGIKNFFRGRTLILGIFLLILATVISAYLFIPKATVRVFVEPRILEKETQVVADPSVKELDEENKKIPGQIVETEISGSGKTEATGKKQVGENAKGTVKIINNTNESQSFSKGATITASNGLKFTLDVATSVASTSAVSESKSTATATVTASTLGPDSNLPSGTQFTIAGASSSSIAVVSEGNFSGGTSKEVTVVSDADQKKLLAQVASDLRSQAQGKLQEKLPDKKILEEALSEEIIKRSYSKNINDQAEEFSLNLTARYKGTAFDESDLKTIVSKLVSTTVPEGFQLDIAESETQSDVSKVEKDGRVIFLAKFKAKLMPAIDTEKIKNQIRFKTPNEVADILRGVENVLGSEIEFSPPVPSFLQRLPLLSNNIRVEVGLK